MINFRNSPFLWISLLLLLSYSIARKVFSNLQHDAIILFSILCGLCFFLSVCKYSPRFQFVTTFTIAVLIFSAAVVRLNKLNSLLYKGDLIEVSQFSQGIFSVRQVLKNKGSSVTLSCRAIAMFDSKEQTEIKAFDKNILLYVRITEPQNFLPRDVIRAEGWLSAIKRPMNPDAFDARTYYATLGIRHQLFCNAENLSLEKSGGFSIARMTAQWQAFLSGMVRKNVSPQVAQLTNALVWGDRSDMDPEVRDAFAESGAMHVLSVSGMHVAIIYSMLFFLLGPPGDGPFTHRLLRFSSYATAIILYMGLTGACPAVVRAGLMILLYLLGKSMGWNTQIWNLLGFAAFLMLWINPYISYNIGFQLSFLAMAGILLYAKPIIRSYSAKNILLHHVWEITALSIAAQIFILPVLLGQFFQFPLTFILSSIVAAPAAYIIMFGALVNIILSFTGFTGGWHALDWAGKIFIAIMKWMSELNPLMHFSLPSLGNMLLMSMAVLFSFALVFKWPSGRKLAWVCGIMALISLGCNRIKQWSVQEILIYHSPKGLLLDVINEGYCYSILDCSLSPAQVEFPTRAYRCRRDVIHVQSNCLSEDWIHDQFLFEKSVLTIKNKSLFLANTQNCPVPGDNYSHIIIEECLETEYLEQLAFQHQNTTYILPAHLDRKCIVRMKDYFTENKIALYDISEEGYFRLSL